MEPTATETTGDGESGIIHIASLYTKDSSAEPQNLGGVVTSRRAKEVVPAAVPPEPLLDLTAHLHNARTDGRLLGWMDGQAGAIDLADMVTIAAIESSRRALPDAVLKGRLREATWDRISPHLLQDTPLIAFRVMALAFEPADPSLTEVPGRASEDCFE